MAPLACLVILPQYACTRPLRSLTNPAVSSLTVPSRTVSPLAHAYTRTRMMSGCPFAMPVKKTCAAASLGLDPCAVLAKDFAVMFTQYVVEHQEGSAPCLFSIERFSLAILATATRSSDACLSISFVISCSMSEKWRIMNGRISSSVQPKLRM